MKMANNHLCRAILTALAVLAGCVAPRSPDPCTPLMTLGGADGPGMYRVAEIARENRAVVLGELHGFAENYEIAMRIFKELHRNAGYDVLALELSFTDADSLNEYLETGNEFRLNDTSLFRNPTAGNSEEYMEFFRELRGFYETLPSGRKFEIWGLDLCDTFPWVVRGHVTGRIMNLKDPQLRSAMLEAVPKATVLGEEQVSQLASRFESLLGGSDGPKGAKELLFFLHRLTDCFRAARKWWESHYGNRDRIWIEFVRFNLERSRNPDNIRIFAFCGARHARKKPVFEGESVFAEMLSGSVKGFEGRVATLLAYPLSAPGMDPPDNLAHAGRGLARRAVSMLDAARDGSILRERASYPLLLSRPKPAELSEFYDAVLLYRRGTPVRLR